MQMHCLQIIKYSIPHNHYCD